MKINFILSFDYELPLGEVESYEKGLFEPAQKLLSLANKLRVPIVLFADICSAIRFKEWDITFYNKFKSQIQSAIRDKHDVQLHIHPHWIDSEFKDGKFIPSPHFGLSDFKENTNFPVSEIIKLSHHALIEICAEVNKDYQCVAFRAGGYNVEPESKIILNSLYDQGIRYESSVIQGLFQNYSFSKIDYRQTPNFNNWRISKDGPLDKATKSSPFLFELPITSMPNSIFNIIQRRIAKTMNKRVIQSRIYNNTGKGFNAISKQNSWFDKIKMAKNPIVLTFDRDYLSVKDLEKIVDYNVKQFQNEKEIFITSIAHPKSMGEYHLNLMNDFVLLMKTKYGDNLFTTYQSISDKNQL